MSDPYLELVSEVDPAWVRLLSQGLADFNQQVTGYDDRQALAVLVRDHVTAEVVGGLSGRSSLGLLFLELVYLPPAYRGQGLGPQLLAMAEAEGRRRGCKAGVLYTISFQAPIFYERLGWQRFGEIDCDPPDTQRIFMRKTL